MTDFRKYKDITYNIIGAAMKVHNELSWGLLESIYQEALCLELKDCGVENVKTEVEVKCYYKDHLLNKSYRIDLLVDDIIIELKAVDEITPIHRAQLFHYMRLTKKPVGLLINFGAESLQGERYGLFQEFNTCALLDKNMLPVLND